MIYFSIVFLCVAGLYVFLLEDRFPLWATLSGTAVCYIASLVLGGIIKNELAACAAGCVLFFAASIPLYKNNILQKLLPAVLSVSNYCFMVFFLPLLLGFLPFKTAGAFAGFFSVAVYILFSLLFGLVLYRPLRHFSDRGPSGFLIGIMTALIFIALFSRGRFDFLFRTNILAARFLVCAVIYAAVIFALRSVYQAGRFRENATISDARRNLLQMEKGDFEDMLTAVRDVRSAEKAGEYALETVNVLLADGSTDRIPEYIAAAKNNLQQNPILATYHEDPYLNAVIATKASYAQQNSIDFECNVAPNTGAISVPELCILVNEMLTRACRDAAQCEGERKVRFTAFFVTGGSMKLEAVYTSPPLAGKERLSFKGKKVSEIASRLFEDRDVEAENLRGLDNTREIITRRSGKLVISSVGGEAIIQATFGR